MQRERAVVENVPTFRRRKIGDEICFMPEISEKRKTTDVSFLISFGLCIIVLLSLMIYAVCNSDIKRFIRGYDNCGNVCGSKNSPVEGISCSGKDMTDKPFLLYYSTSYSRYSNECVERCSSGQKEKFHRCLIDSRNSDLDFFPYTIDAAQEDSTNLIILCFVGLGLSVLTLILFRYYLKAFVWTMLLASILLMFAVTGYFWYLYSDADSYDASVYLRVAIVFTIVSIVFALCILVLTVRIKFVIYFFEEAIRIVFAMPLILLEPVLTIGTNFIVVVLFIYTSLLIATSGNLQVDEENGGFDYVPNGAMLFVLWWNVIMMVWMIQFVLACQQIVISGAVATYYFTRDKLQVVSPIYNSFYNLVRFHLGTVAFGSFTVTVITVIKMIIRALDNRNNLLRLFYICLRPLEDLLKYLTSMGYIETAIHGQPLCRSSLRAINLIVANLLSALVMNNIGSFVFFMAKFVVVAITVGVGFLLNLSTVSIVLGGVVALLCVHCFFVVFEIAVDTIFICYCEDQCINDGNTNPYCATIEFHNHIKVAQILTYQLEQAKQKKK